MRAKQCCDLTTTESKGLRRRFSTSKMHLKLGRIKDQESIQSRTTPEPGQHMVK